MSIHLSRPKKKCAHTASGLIWRSSLSTPSTEIKTTSQIGFYYFIPLEP